MRSYYKPLYMKKIFALFFFSVLFITVSKAQYVNIPDANFRAFIVQNYPNSIGWSTGQPQLDTTDIDVLNATKIACSNGNISDLTGIQYFKKLLELNCDTNSITTLKHLPTSLLRLSCQHNYITSIDKLPTNIDEFYCDYNNLTSLPALPVALSSFTCSNNQLTSLPAIPAGTIFIYCTYNQLTSLPALPASLDQIICDNNFITNLPALPANLYNLECCNNPITSLPVLPSALHFLRINQTKIKQLPALPNSLTDLQISYDTITNLAVLPPVLSSFDFQGCGFDSIPSLPQSITYLYGRYNKLKKLPVLPSGLISLDCNTNLLTDLPELPKTLNYLYCYSNNIYCLPVLPDKLTILWIDSTKIKCLPNAINNVFSFYHAYSFNVSGKYYMNYAPIKAMPFCNATNNANNCQAFPQISGNVFYDQNNNGIKDANEYGDAYTMVVLSNGRYAFTDTSGNYKLTADTLGTFSEAVLVPPYIVPNPGIQSFTFNRYDTAVAGKNVALYSTTSKDSLSIAITPLTLAGRPGGNFIYHVNFTNEGSTVLSPNIVFNYDNSLLTYTSSNLPSVANTGNSLTLNYNSLAPMRSIDFIISFKVKTTAQMGNVLSATASIAAASATATDSTSNVLVSSFDPNDKAATAKLTPTQVVKGDRIRYTIRFQNTGTASAINVVVADTLSSLLQSKTLDIIATSHPCKITMKGNIVYFEFLNINLPDSFHYKDLSHGFVTFSIKPLSTLTLGNMIPNTASIYFDYNKPVVTNTAKTIISNTVFPVNMAAFTASLINKESVILNWVTAEEINTISFNIQQSTNGRDFVTIGNESAKGRGSYNYTTILTNDDSRFKKLYYRLEIIDKDGSKTYSEIRTVLRTNDDSRFTISPNPAHSYINIKGKGIAQVNIIDNMGRVVVNKKAATAVDEMKIELHIKPGVYVAQVIAEDGSRNNEKFIVE